MRAYLKFFGTDDKRFFRQQTIRSEIIRSRCHCVAGFSPRRMPVQFAPGDILFLGRMVKAPDDYVVFGRAVVLDQFRLPRDQATAKDIIDVPFRKDWPYYLRINSTRFIEGNLENGVTIAELIDTLGYESFARSKVRYAQGDRGFSIRTLFSHQSHMELTGASLKWLETRFSEQIDKYGNVEKGFLDSIPKPENW